LLLREFIRRRERLRRRCRSSPYTMPGFLFKETISVRRDAELPLAAMLTRIAVVAYLRAPGLHAAVGLLS
jgi:hypothetical protein